MPATPQWIVRWDRAPVREAFARCVRDRCGFRIGEDGAFSDEFPWPCANRFVFVQREWVNGQGGTPRMLKDGLLGHKADWLMEGRRILLG